MVFEKYLPGKDRTRTSRKVTATFWKNGEMRFSREAVRKFELEKYQYVELYFDGETQRLGIVPVEAKTADALKLRRGRTGTLVRVEGILAKHGIILPEKTEKRLSRDSESGMLTVQLKGTRKNRPAKKQSR